MPTQNYVVFTGPERDAAMAFNNDDAAVDPVLVSNLTPGVGLNINPAALSFAAGAVVPLDGKYVAPKQIVNNAFYPQGMKDYLQTLPWAILEDETIFAPWTPPWG